MKKALLSFCYGSIYLVWSLQDIDGDIGIILRLVSIVRRDYIIKCLKDAGYEIKMLEPVDLENLEI